MASQLLRDLIRKPRTRLKFNQFDCRQAGCGMLIYIHPPAQHLNMKKSKFELNDTELNVITVSGRVFVEEKAAEYRKMRADIENGLVTPEEIRQRNCVHWDDDFEFVPWDQKGPMWYE